MCPTSFALLPQIASNVFRISAAGITLPLYLFLRSSKTSSKRSGGESRDVRGVGCAGLGSGLGGSGAGAGLGASDCGSVVTALSVVTKFTTDLSSLFSITCGLSVVSVVSVVNFCAYDALNSGLAFRRKAYRLLVLFPIFSKANVKRIAVRRFSCR